YSYYFSNQIGNKIYNASFQVPYAGMLVPGLPDSQNISQLNALGIQVPYTNLVKAAQYWGDFWNSSARTTMGLGGTAANPTYNGHPLDVPIFVLQSDPPDEAGATTWVQMLQSFIPGLDGGAQDVIQTSEVNIFLTWAVPRGDPMPISWGGWAPDYPYPTDYLSAMFLPSTISTYQNANSWNSSYVGGVTTSNYGSNSFTDPAEANALNNITIAYYRGVANETNPTQAAFWFQKMNELSINMTMEVYL
ncbi:ABC-type peptide transport system, solute-binding component, partial [mine drainage metagenome]